MAVLGLCLMAVGQYTLANRESVATFTKNWLGGFGLALTSFMAATFAQGVALGLGLLLAGALLVAVVIGLPVTNEQRPAEATDDRLSSSVARRAGYRLVALAAALSGFSVLSLGRAAPGMGSVCIWLGALISAFFVARSSDRIRGTRFGHPFPERWEWTALFVLVVLDLILVAHDLAHWRWAGTPDESFFFMTAKELASGRSRPFPLAERGVFGYHPLLSSYYQAGFMRVFGSNIFAWRLSSSAALAMSLPFLYLFTRELWNRRAGFIAAVLFGSAQLAVGFSHLGYNNVQVYPVLLGSLGILAWSIRRRSLAGHYLAGCIAGLGFYTFYPARLALPLTGLLLWSFGRLSLTRARAELLALVSGILLAVLPVLTHPGEIVTHMVQQTAFGAGRQPTLADWQASVRGLVEDPAPLEKIGTHWLGSILYAPWTKCGWNFDWNPAVDPVAAALAMLGLWLGVLGLRRRSGVRVLLPAYLFAAFVVGAVTPYDCPPLTRLLTLAPFTALFAAISVDRLMSCASQVVRYRPLVWLGGIGLVAAAVLWNVSALHRSMYHLHHGYGNGTTGELIRLTTQISESYRIVYVQHGDNDSYNVDQILDEYNLGERSTYIRPFGPRAVETLAAIAPPFAVVYDLKRDEEVRAVEQALEQRFPGIHWYDSAPGKEWNLRYCLVPDGVNSQ